MEEITGLIEKITYTNEENGFTVARLKLPFKKELTTAVGILPLVKPGETIRCKGEWKKSPLHGLQFAITECEIEAPSDLVGIQKYLESGLIKGIGPSFAEKIVNQFGLKTFDILENAPEELLKIPGLGKKKMERVKECFKEQKSIRELILFLQKFQVSPAHAHRIYRVYKENAIAKIQENVYLLAREVPLIGFKTADQMAQKMGICKEDPFRIACGIEHLLLSYAEEGHVCYPLGQFVVEAAKALDVTEEEIHSQIQVLEEDQRIVKSALQEELYLFLKGYYLAEVGIAHELARICQALSPLRTIDMEKALEWVEKKLLLELETKQREAVKEALTKKVHIITGGPGTGKSTITKAILTITCALTPHTLLAAPTGRAAKRLSEITRREAHTIHSLLQYDFTTKTFRRNQENPLKCDLIVLDESSMIDTLLMYHLLKAIPDQARVLFIGDIHQLPSIGPGNVLKELIESNTLSVTTLTEIFRQAKGSRIITNAHLINQGEFPELQQHEESDFLFIGKETPEEIAETLGHLVSSYLPERYRFHPQQDIQVLAPMKRGIVGIEELNHSLKKLLNPLSRNYTIRGCSYAVGDKVMQIKNNYTKEIYNGDIGKITAIDSEEGLVVVSFEGREVEYSYSEMEEITLAYATSVHKYQGSESPCIVIPFHTCHFPMLHRNLLYTAVTRGKKLVVVVGSKKALSIAVGNDKIKTRYTGLKRALHTQLAGSL